MKGIRNRKVKIGCASGFWGDTSTAAKQLVDDNNIDYLVFDFLAEVTMSILAGSKLKNPNLGYATDFVTQLSPLLKDLQTKSIKVISNAGGINPEACRSMLVEEAKKVGVDLKIAIVFGDDLINSIDELKRLDLKEIDTNKPLPENILSINAYLGAPAIAAALKEGADIVITGRCVDSAMVLGPLMHEFNWKHDDYDYLANGSLAGHIIECGAQCTGGNFTDWEGIKGFDNIGFPLKIIPRIVGSFLIEDKVNWISFISSLDSAFLFLGLLNQIVNQLASYSKIRCLVFCNFLLIMISLFYFNSSAKCLLIGISYSRICCA
tara:strand:- start:340 stop:1302 length:963 start_codon:yes stop_codon:yes gene_type:complete